MKNHPVKIVVSFLFIAINGFSQTPFLDIIVDNRQGGNIQQNFVTSTNIIAPSTPSQPDHFHANSNVLFQAGQEVDLKPGFHAGVFTANGSFVARIQKPDLDAVIISPGTSVGKYQRFEVGVSLPVSIQSQINNFIDNPNSGGINPYDPDQIKIKADFHFYATNFTATRFGFYYQDVTVNNNAWNVNTQTPYPFRVRFAPPFVGSWTVTITLLLNNVPQPNVFTGDFNVVSSSNPGFLAVGQHLNLKYAESGNSFFAIGQNIPFAGDAYNVADPSAFNDQRDLIFDLAANKGNFVRVRMDPWSNGLEWDTPLPGNYQSRQNHAWELDKTLTLCETGQPVYIMLNLEDDQVFSTHNIYGAPFFTWQGEQNDSQHPNGYNPYYALLGGTSVNPSPELFLTDAVAKKYFKKRLFYIIARWGYSPNIGIWELMNETDRMGVYDDVPNSLYKDQSSFRQSASNWINEMTNYLHSFYPLHPVTTGYTGGDRNHLTNRIIIQMSLAPIHMLMTYI